MIETHHPACSAFHSQVKSLQKMMEDEGTRILSTPTSSHFTWDHGKHERHFKNGSISLPELRLFEGVSFLSAFYTRIKIFMHDKMILLSRQHFLCPLLTSVPTLTLHNSTRETINAYQDGTNQASLNLHKAAQLKRSGFYKYNKNPIKMRNYHLETNILSSK